MKDIAYLATPYSDLSSKIREYRFKKVTEVAAMLFKSHIICFSPISHSHPIALNGCGTDWDTWEEFDKQMMDLCKKLFILMLPGWYASIGVKHEYKYMRKQRKEVFFIELIYDGKEVELKIKEREEAIAEYDDVRMFVQDIAIEMSKE